MQEMFLNLIPTRNRNGLPLKANSLLLALPLWEMYFPLTPTKNPSGLLLLGGGGVITYIPVTFVAGEPDPDTGESIYSFSTTESYNSLKSMVMNGGIPAFIGVVTRTLIGGETSISQNVLCAGSFEEDEGYYGVTCVNIFGMFASAFPVTDITDPDDPIVFECSDK